MTNLFRFAIYIRTGILTAETFNISLYLGSFHAGRAFGGTMLSSRLGGTLVRRVIIFFLLLSGVAPCGDKSPHITAFPVVYLQQDP